LPGLHPLLPFGAGLAAPGTPGGAPGSTAGEAVARLGDREGVGWEKIGKNVGKMCENMANHGKIRGNHRKIRGKHEICWVIAWDLRAFNGDRMGLIGRYFLICKDLKDLTY
jgi:hypothetical protein